MSNPQVYPCVMCGKPTSGSIIHLGGVVPSCYEHYEDGTLARYLEEWSQHMAMKWGGRNNEQFGGVPPEGGSSVQAPVQLARCIVKYTMNGATLEKEFVAENDDLLLEMVSEFTAKLEALVNE